MTFRRYLALAVLVWSAFFFYGIARAETVGATPFSKPREKVGYCDVTCTIKAADAKSVCDTLIEQKKSSMPTIFFVRLDGTGDNRTCVANTKRLDGSDQLEFGMPVQAYVGCPAGNYEGGMCVGYSCPDSSYVLNGQSCTRPDCSAGQVRGEDGMCKVSCPAAGSNAMIAGVTAWGIAGGSTACMAGLAYGGCRMACSSGVSSGGKASCTGCTFSGLPSNQGEPVAQPFVPDKAKPTTPDGCMAAGQGYVTSSSGSTTCVPVSASPNPTEKTTSETTTKSTPGGPTTTSDTTTKTNCNGATCTETKTTSTPDGVTTETKTAEASDFCTKNPTSPACKAVDKCEEQPDLISCAKMGEAPEEGAVEGKSIGVSSISVVGLASSNACPASMPLPKNLGVYNWQPICDFASALKPIVLALAWLTAGLIVIGSIRG
jgi:hypothetical protein